MRPLIALQFWIESPSGTKAPGSINGCEAWSGRQRFGKVIHAGWDGCMPVVVTDDGFTHPARHVDFLAEPIATE